MSRGVWFLVSKSLLLAIHCKHLKQVWLCTSKTCLLYVTKWSNTGDWIVLCRKSWAKPKSPALLLKFASRVEPGDVQWQQTWEAAALQCRKLPRSEPVGHRWGCTGVWGGKDSRTANEWEVTGSYSEVKAYGGQLSHPRTESWIKS